LSEFYLEPIYNVFIKVNRAVFKKFIHLGWLQEHFFAFFKEFTMKLLHFKRMARQQFHKPALMTLAVVGLQMGLYPLGALSQTVPSSSQSTSQSIPQNTAKNSATANVSAKNEAVSNYDRNNQIFQPVFGTGGMVASDQALASAVGAEILKQGGNAVDAAVATGFALAVVLPYAGNLGGGGFMMIHRQKPLKTTAIDFREVAPSGASRDMYLDEKGQVIKGMSTQSVASVGVPGSVAGLLMALDQYGTFSQSAVIQPAIVLARQGFTVSHELAGMLASHRNHLGKSTASRKVFFVKRDENVTCVAEMCPLDELKTLSAGDKLVQTDLAQTLERIAQQGRQGFYEGTVAESILKTLNVSTADTQQHDSNQPIKARTQPLFTAADLTTYQPLERQPIWGSYRGVAIASMPPPSSGGVHLIQMLNMLEALPLSESGWGSAQTIHDLAQVARFAYADRAEYLGDTDFVKVPLKGLTSKAYAKSLVSQIDLSKATKSTSVKAGNPLPYESDQTTHYSVIDAQGNMVSTTTTLNLNFGSGWMAEGTGVLLNNEMDDFSVKAGVPNAFGLIGNEANNIQPGKRPLSSMTPTLVFRDDQPWFATGSPGGARIITTVLQQIVNVVDFNMNIAQAAAAPRMHHQWLPDYIRVEQGFSPDTLALLRAMGHEVRVMGTMGRIQSVQRSGVDPASAPSGTTAAHAATPRVGSGSGAMASSEASKVVNDTSMMQGVSDPRSPDGAAISVRP
jgi:gamma-glutamyltranspeptidase/glutathione hydrolase